MIPCLCGSSPLDVRRSGFSSDIEDPDELNAIVQVSLTGELIDTRHAPLHHHAFAQLGDDRYAYVAADMRDHVGAKGGDPEPVVGDAIVIVEPDGSTTEVFNTWDDWDAEVCVAGYATPFYGDVPDWTHANGLYWYPESDTYLLSAGYAEAVLEIDASTGHVTRSFGVEQEIGIEAGSPGFFFQHSAHWTGEDTMMMTTRYAEDPNHPEDSMIIALEYQVVDGALREIWSYGKDQHIDSIAEGQALRMANGNTLLNWGFTGICREVTPSGELAWEVEAGFGAALVRMRPLASFYDSY